MIEYKQPWDLVSEAIEANRQPRIIYKKILGESLTQYCYRCFKQGISWQRCYDLLQPKLIDHYHEDFDGLSEALRRSKIRIWAAYCEQGMNQKAFQEAFI